MGARTKSCGFSLTWLCALKNRGGGGGRRRGGGVSNFDTFWSLSRHREFSKVSSSLRNILQVIGVLYVRLAVLLRVVSDSTLTKSCFIARVPGMIFFVKLLEVTLGREKMPNLKISFFSGLTTALGGSKSSYEIL